MNTTHHGCLLLFLLPFFGAGVFMLHAAAVGVSKGASVAVVA